MSNETRRPAGIEGGSQIPSGTTRRGRRERERHRDRSRYSSTRRPFVERRRGLLMSLAVAAGVVLVGGFLFVQVTSKAYACTTMTEPAPAATPLPNGSPAPLGQVQPDMGRSHVAPGAPVRYTYCPPASGNHYTAAGSGPIQPRFYGPDEATIPQGWIHNLEHGGIVVLYSCDLGGCSDTNQRALQDLFQNFPDSPICHIPKGTISPVITRFDNGGIFGLFRQEMNAPFAALVWGRILFQQNLDTAQMLDFFRTEAELHNPEQQCQRPSPSPESPAPSGSESPASSVSPSPASSESPSASPSAEPSPSPS